MTAKGSIRILTNQHRFDRSLKEVVLGQPRQGRVYRVWKKKLVANDKKSLESRDWVKSVATGVSAKLIVIQTSSQDSVGGGGGYVEDAVGRKCWVGVEGGV